MPKTIDITPTWREILPTLLVILSDATTAEARKTALDELLRMADLADRAVAANELRLCEAARVKLRPNQLYIFTVDEECPACREAL